jgi:branched-chain amino acid transport system ATP-binding protein
MISLLRLEQVHSGYGPVNILFDISLEVNAGEIVSLIGANGAGKSTLLKTLSGLLRCTRGRILFSGKDITKFPPHRVVDLGIIQIPEGRQVIGELTVLENLKLGCYRKFNKLGREGRKNLMDRVFALFPTLRERTGQTAGTLSGGEQQMLAIGRALMGEPKLLLTDEPSLGLAPMIVEALCDVIKKLNQGGLTVLLVEQNALIALEMGQRAYVLEEGRITLQGKGTDLLHEDKVRESYLGV